MVIILELELIYWEISDLFLKVPNSTAILDIKLGK